MRRRHHCLVKLTALLILFALLPVASLAQKFLYPKTATIDHVDIYHGTKVADPYRWLEDETSPSVASWVEEQNKVTFGYLETIPFRSKMRERLEKIYNYPKYSAPSKKGEYYIYSKNDGLMNQSVVYIQKGIDGVSEVFIDPNKLSEDGTARLVGLSFSKDAKYAAYGVSKGGSDWRDFYVMEVATRKLLPERIRWIKNSGVSWQGYGFYYSRYDVPKDTTKLLSATNEFQKVHYHKLGTDQNEDVLVYEDNQNPLRFHFVSTTDDERFEILYISDRGKGMKGNAFSVRDRKKGEKEFRPIITTFESNYSVVDNVEGKLIVSTNKNAPKEKVVLIDPENPGDQFWQTILPEREEPLKSVTTAGSKLIATYMKDVADKVFVYDLSGKRENEIQLPTLGTASGFGGVKEDTEVFYSFTSFTFPSTIYRYDLSTRKSVVFRSSEVDYKSGDYETKQIFYTSKDGTRIPMFIVHKKGIKLDGKNPTLLYGYGGFNVSMRPSFNPLLVALLEQGVVYAMANLRGGGEYGEQWHMAGTVLNKQNVFDDFIAAGEWLIKQKYTSSEKLGIQGGSNGGLLVGAVMNQRPDLVKVALAAVGVMDMLRYQKFTIGWNWAPDYGTSDDSTQFEYLYRYSPLHNLKDGVSYPATLVTTADHDDRVVPAHSYKYAATLQAKHRGNNPVMIRIGTKSGHGASNTAKMLEETADVYSFFLYNVGLVPK